MVFLSGWFEVEKVKELTGAEKKFNEAVNDCLNFAKVSNDKDLYKYKFSMVQHTQDLSLDFTKMAAECRDQYAKHLGIHFYSDPAQYSRGQDSRDSLSANAKVNAFNIKMEQFQLIREKFIDEHHAMGETVASNDH